MTLNLDAIKALLASDTEGPWRFTPEILGLKNTTVMAGDEQVGYFSVGQAQPHDAEFIAAARQDIPDLIAEVERLQAVISAVVEFCSDFCTEGCCEVCKGQNEAYQQVLDIIRESKKA